VISAVWSYFVFGDAQGFIQQWFVGENARCFNTTRRADDHLRMHDVLNVFGYPLSQLRIHSET
jgi:hypothetical protein